MAISSPWSPSWDKPLSLPRPRPSLHPLRLGRAPSRSPWSIRSLPLLAVLSGAFTMVLLYVLLSLGPCLVGGSCYKGFRSAYSFDANLARHPAWMRELSDEVNLTSLSIPGTHDTMTYDIGEFSLQCQNWNLSTQLRAGLRYVDIRARLQDDTLHIFHGNEPTGHSYQDVLTTVFTFLDANPSEVIVMRLKEEGGPVGHNNHRSFQQAFDWARLESPATRPGAEKHLYIYNDTSQPIPTLGQLRSKVFLLQNWVDPGPHRDDTYGLRWEGPQMVLEDLWIIPDLAHLRDKWRAIESALQKADTDALDNQHLYLAHISASVGVLPIEASAGPKNKTRPDDGMNDKTGLWVDAHVRGGLRTGIVIFDFPGKKAIEAVLRWNWRFVKRRTPDASVL